MAVLLVTTVPDAVKTAFKKACDQAHRSMASVVVELMRRFIMETGDVDLSEVNSAPEVATAAEEANDFFDSSNY